MFASLILCLMEIMVVNSSGCLAFLDVAGTTERRQGNQDEACADKKNSQDSVRAGGKKRLEEQEERQAKESGRGKLKEEKATVSHVEFFLN